MCWCLLQAAVATGSARRPAGTEDGEDPRGDDARDDLQAQIAFWHDVTS